jgi:hypothetical protein
MFCTKCQHDLSECECPDLIERMAKLSQHPNFALGPGSSFFANPRVRKTLGMDKGKQNGHDGASA